jgi:hypothetical protein
LQRVLIHPAGGAIELEVALGLLLCSKRLPAFIPLD